MIKNLTPHTIVVNGQGIPPSLVDCGGSIPPPALAGRAQRNGLLAENRDGTRSDYVSGPVGQIQRERRHPRLG